MRRSLVLLATLLMAGTSPSLHAQSLIPSTSLLNSTYTPGTGFNLDCVAAGSRTSASSGPTGTATFTDLTESKTLGTLSLGAPYLYFGPPGVTSLPNSAFRLVVGDFNNDGKDDLAFYPEGPNAGLFTTLSNGDGTFAPPTTLDISDSPSVTNVVAGKFSAGGNVDLAVLAVTTRATSTSSLILLQGDGTGNFVQNATSYVLTSAGANDELAVGMVTGDFNNDGKTDVAISGQAGSLWVFLGNGDGTFKPLPVVSIPAVGTGGFGYAVSADFNNDGHPDLAFANGTVLLGNGDGTFSAGTNLPETGGDIVTADFNGDGKPDIALVIGGEYGSSVGVDNPSGIAVLLGNGDGTFQSPVTYLTGQPPLLEIPQSIVAGKFTGKLGLIITESEDLALFPGNGDGTFATPAFFQSAADFTNPGPASLATGNFDGKGDAGIAAGTDANLYVSAYLYGWTQILNAADASLDNVLFTSLVDQAHQVECAYSGDAVYAPSTSAAQSIAYVQAANPSISPSSESFSGSISVTMAAPTPGTQAYYTTDGSTPTSGSTPYTGPLTVSSSVTIKAIASGTGYADSDVTTVAYTVQVPQPVISPVTGAYSTPQVVTITDSQSGATIYYTVDGSDPTTSSPVYAGQFTVSANTVVKAFAAASGYENSNVASATFTIVSPPPPAIPQPVVTPISGAYSTPQTVGITDSQSGATIHYTTDGSVPTASSPVYSGQFTVSTSTVVKAIAVASGYTNSPPAWSALTYGPFQSQAALQINLTTPNQPTNVYNMTCTITGRTVAGAGPTGNVTFSDVTTGQTLATVALPSSTSSPDFMVTGTLPNSPYPTATGDFNGDGIPDLILQGSPLQIALGNGDGTFQSPTAINVPGAVSAQAVVAGDFNNDGKLDLAMASDAGLVILLGNGDGTFQTPILAGSGGTGVASQIVTGHFSESLSLDIAIAGSSGLGVWLGGGDGTFAFADTLSSSSLPGPIVAGPFTGSGRDDIADINELGAIGVWASNPDGTFQSPVSTEPPPGTVSASDMVGDLVAGYFNNDGHLDLVYGSPSGANDTVALVLGNGDGTFQYGSSYPTTIPGDINAAMTIATGQFSGTVNPAVVALGGPGYTPAASILNGTGNGTLQAAVNVPIPNLSSTTWPIPFAAVDLNGDGNSDLVLPTPAIYSSMSSANAYVANIAVDVGTIADHTVQCSYPGDSSFSSSSAQMLLTYEPAPPPSISLRVGTYTGPQTVSITDSVSQYGANIYYTLDGSTPTTSSTLYTAPFVVSTTTTVKAFAVGGYYLPSAVSEAVYTIASTPQFSFAGGTYTPPQNVSITDSTPNASVYYTTDGSAPTAESARYTAPVQLTGSLTLKAIAIAPGYLNSAVASATYTPPASKTGLTVSSLSVDTGQTVTLTATVTGSSPTGSVIFNAGTTEPNKVTLTNGTATLQTHFSTAGSYAITASYSGDANNAASNSSVVNLTVTVPVSPSYSVSANPTSQTITAGQSATYVITVTPSGGYSASTSFACTALPGKASCSFSPSTVTPSSGPASTTLTISTTAPSNAANHTPAPWRTTGGLALAGLLGLMLRPRRARRWLRMIPCLLLLGAALLSASACGGGGSGSGSGGNSNPGTPAGTYSVSVDASGSGAANQSLKIQLIVQ